MQINITSRRIIAAFLGPSVLRYAAVSPSTPRRRASVLRAALLTGARPPVALPRLSARVRSFRILSLK